MIQEIMCRWGHFRDSIADVPGGRDGATGSRSAIVHGVFPDPQVPAAGVRQLTAIIRELVPSVALGNAKRCTDDRRNRINPRVIKRKMSKWPERILNIDGSRP